MAMMLRTVNPQAAAELGYVKVRRPYVGQMLLFHTRDGEHVAGKYYHPALCTKVHADNETVEVLIFFDAGEYRRLDNVPHKTDQNRGHAWSFTEHDEKHYQPEDFSTLAPPPVVTPPIEQSLAQPGFSQEEILEMHTELMTMRGQLAKLVQQVQAQTAQDALAQESKQQAQQKAQEDMREAAKQQALDAKQKALDAMHDAQLGNSPSTPPRPRSNK